jgi:hypothetical protein
MLVNVIILDKILHVICIYIDINLYLLQVIFKFANFGKKR